MLPHVTIKACLDGASPDLEYLATTLPSGDVHVARDGDRFYLVATERDTRQPAISSTTLPES
jgi:hypothetical protein